MILESWPPISKIVWTSGYNELVPTAWAVISFFTTFAFNISPINFLAEPVVPIPFKTYSLGKLFFKISINFFTAPIGFPSVQI